MWKDHSSEWDELVSSSWPWAVGFCGGPESRILHRATWSPVVWGIGRLDCLGFPMQHCSALWSLVKWLCRAVDRFTSSFSTERGNDRSVTIPNPLADVAHAVILDGLCRGVMVYQPGRPSVNMEIAWLNFHVSFIDYHRHSNIWCMLSIEPFKKVYLSSMTLKGLPSMVIFCGYYILVQTTIPQLYSTYFFDCCQSHLMIHIRISFNECLNYSNIDSASENFFWSLQIEVTSRAKDFLSLETFKKPCLKLWQLFSKQSSKS